MSSNFDRPFTEKQKLEVYGALSFLVSLGLIICLFFAVCFVNNTSYGIEVSANGFNLAFAAVSGKFKSSSHLFGDVSVPFYYYARAYTRILGVISLLTLFATIALAVATYINVYKGSTKFGMINMAGCFVVAGLFFASFVVALTMNSSDIVPIYCGGNPKCSIGGLTIIPAAFAIGNGILNYFYGKKLVEFNGAKDLENAKTRS